MKVKHAIIFIVIGYCINVVGTLNKILHARLADDILTFGSFIIIVGWLLLLYKILTHPKCKTFLDW